MEKFCVPGPPTPVKMLSAKTMLPSPIPFAENELHVIVYFAIWLHETRWVFLGFFLLFFFHTCTEGSDESERAKSRTINKFIAGTSIRSRFLSHQIAAQACIKDAFSNMRQMRNSDRVFRH